MTYKYTESSLSEIESITIDDAGLILSLGWDNATNNVDSNVRCVLIYILIYKVFTRLLI